MSEWVAFIIALGEETISWLDSMLLFGVPLAGFIVGLFLMSVIFKIFYKP